jgi:vesicle-fusing ATPase
MSASPRLDVNTFVPGLDAHDETAAYWLQQVTVRLRREVSWRWHLRQGVAAPHGDALPHPESPLLESLDLVRHAEAKQQFFRTDITARFLT